MANMDARNINVSSTCIRQ